MGTRASSRRRSRDGNSYSSADWHFESSRQMKIENISNNNCCRVVKRRELNFNLSSQFPAVQLLLLSFFSIQLLRSNMIYLSLQIFFTTLEWWFLWVTLHFTWQQTPKQAGIGIFIAMKFHAFKSLSSGVVIGGDWMLTPSRLVTCRVVPAANEKLVLFTCDEWWRLAASGYAILRHWNVKGN